MSNNATQPWNPADDEDPFPPVTKAATGTMTRGPEWENNGVYQGVVEEQRIGPDKMGKQKLYLHVNLTHKLKNRHNPKKGTEPLPEQLAGSRMVSFKLDPANAQFGKAMTELGAYGFKGNLEALHPEAPAKTRFSLVGKEVYVRVWVKEDAEAPEGKANLFFLHDPTPRGTSLEEFKNFINENRDAIAEAQGEGK